MALPVQKYSINNIYNVQTILCLTRSRIWTKARLWTFIFLSITHLVNPEYAFTFDFYKGDVEGLFDVTLAYGLISRTDEQDSRLIGFSNGGRSMSVNADDGNLNYNEGLASNMFKATGELELKWHNLGAFARGFAFYDYENNRSSQQRTKLNDDARKLIGRDPEILDAVFQSRR